jgi:hypothetical protein
MARPSRTLCVEILETRRLLSAAKPRTFPVNGSIGGIEGYTHSPSNFNYATLYINGSGTLPVLGAVQMTVSVPPSPTAAEHGTLTLAASEGTLNFNLVSRPHSKTMLTLSSGTGAYVHYKGSGTLVVEITDPPGYRHQFDVINTFKLKLTT